MVIQIESVASFNCNLGRLYTGEEYTLSINLIVFLYQIFNQRFNYKYANKVSAVLENVSMGINGDKKFTRTELNR